MSRPTVAESAVATAHPAPPAPAACRSCGAVLRYTVLDLGMSPLCESFLSAEQVDGMERFYPLLLRVCDQCFLVQLQEYVSGEEIFSEYAYFSSYSDSWLDHCRRYVECAIERFRLGPSSQVVEVASNDGYLLQYFLPHGVPVLGVEPAANVARTAVARGVPTVVRFFGAQTAHEMSAAGQTADLVIGNNVLAQVPDLNDFVAGLGILLKPQGVITIEFPHLVRTIAGNQFDQVYHEHFSYFTLYSAERVFARHGLAVFDVETIPTHGGSLRLYLCHTGDASHPPTDRVAAVRTEESRVGVTTLAYYAGFEARVQATKRKLLGFLIEAKSRGKRICGYGAPGKGNTLLNYCGIRTDFLDFTVDRNPHKHGKYLPGTHIPIFSPERIREARPDYVMVLPWNLREEILDQLGYIREWGGKFLIPIPEPEVVA